MKKMKKLLLTLLSVVLAFTMVFAVACDNNNQDPTPTPTPPSGDGGGGGGSGDGDGGGGSGDGGGGSSTPIDAEKITLPESTLKFSAIRYTLPSMISSRQI